MAKEQSILKNIYLRYTEEALEAELIFLTKKLTNPAYNNEAKEKTTEELKQYFEAKGLFEDFQKHIKANNLLDKNGKLLKTDGMTLAQLFEAFTGKTIGELQSSIGTTAALQVDKVWDKAVDYTRKGAAWTGAALLSFGQKKK